MICLKRQSRACFSHLQSAFLCASVESSDWLNDMGSALSDILGLARSVLLYSTPIREVIHLNATDSVLQLIVCVSQVGRKKGALKQPRVLGERGLSLLSLVDANRLSNRIRSFKGRA